MPSDRAASEQKGESFDWGPLDVPDTDFGDTQITDWAIKQINRQHVKPFFLGVGYYRPHIPLWAPRRFFERFQSTPGVLPPVQADDLQDLGPVGRRWALEPITAGRHETTVRHDQWRAAVEAYLACISYVDHEIGRLLDALDKSDARDNTIIVLWSDHGWQLGEKKHWGKWTGWERSTRVPLIVAPHKNAADQFGVGATCAQAVGLIDIYPTLGDLCQLNVPAGLSGISLRGLLEQPHLSTAREVLTMFNPGNVSLRNNRYRYIEYANGEQELYDLQEDPNEFDNVADNPQYAAIRASLQEALGPYIDQSRLLPENELRRAIRPPSPGQVITVAGTGGKADNGIRGSFEEVNIGQPFGVEIGPDGYLYICEVENHRVWRLDRRYRTLQVVAGTGKRGFTGDGGVATKANMNEPYEVRFDDDGNMYVVEMQNHIVRRIDAVTQEISTVAGTGAPGFAGDGGPASEARLNRPHSIAIHKRHLYIADIGNHRIRQVDLDSGQIETLLGNGRQQLPQAGPIRANSPMVGPRALYVRDQNLWIALREGHSIWKLDLDQGMLTHVAGNGQKGYSGDGGDPKVATFNGPKGIVVDWYERVYVVDTENQVIRRIDTQEDRITTVAGSGQQGDGGDGQSALSAGMDRPHGICVDDEGMIYIGDTNNHRVRAVRDAKPAG
jgi:sugar lactone lactonase YvrE